MVVNKAPGSLYFNSYVGQIDTLHKYSRDLSKFLESFIHVFRTPNRSFGDALPIG